MLHHETLIRIPHLGDVAFARIAELLRARAGIHLGMHKKAMVISRLMPVLRNLGLKSFDDYVTFIDANGKESGASEDFVNALTTNRTEFFRDRQQFGRFARALRKHRKTTQEEGRPLNLRIWSSACSTGEETYTITMIVKEVFGSVNDWKIQILGTDLDTRALRKASSGLYTEENLKTVPRGLRAKYFGPMLSMGKRRIRSDLREMIVFRRVNLVTTPFRFETEVDFVFCRNVLIYFDTATQTKIIAKITNVLRPGGLLFVGHAESSAVSNDDFCCIDVNIHQCRRIG